MSQTVKDTWNQAEDEAEALSERAGKLATGYGKTWEVLLAVLSERRRQDALVLQGKFAWNCGDAKVPWAEKLAVLMEEVGEAANEVVEWIISRDKYAADPQLKAMPPHRERYFRDRLRTELIQVAAVCVAFAESLSEPEVVVTPQNSLARGAGGGRARLGGRGCQLARWPRH